MLSQNPRLFTAHAVADLLKNRFYAGFVSYNGEYFQGQHEALVSQEIFDLAQDAPELPKPRPLPRRLGFHTV